MTTFRKLESTFNRFLYLENEPDFLRVIVSTVLANRLDTVPVWLMVIGTASSGKSEILGALDESTEIYTLSLLTTNTLISGMKQEVIRGKKQKDVSLLPKLNHKVLIIKDASTLSSINSQERSHIFAQFRDAFDGSMRKATGLGDKRFDAKFGIILAGTPAVEAMHSFESALGERFINFRPHIEFGDDVWEKVKKHKNSYVDMKKRLSNAMMEFFDSFIINESIIYPDEIKELAPALSVLRTPALRDTYSKELIYPMEVSELPIRVSKQLCALYTILLQLLDSHKISMQIVKRIVRDSLPIMRIKILDLISRGVDTNAKLSKYLGFSVPYTHRLLNELILLGVIEQTISPSYVRQNPEGKKLIIKKIFKRVTDITPRFEI